MRFTHFFLALSLVACGRAKTPAPVTTDPAPIASPGEALPPGGPVQEAPPLRTVAGTLYIHSSLDLDALADVHAIEGDLVVEATALPTFVFPKLQRITGDLTIVHNPDLVTIALPELEEVGGHIAIRDAAALQTLDLGVLETAGSVELARLPTLEHVDGLTGLVDVDFTGTDLVALEGLAFPSLATGSLVVSSCPELRSLELPVLADAGMVQLGALPLLEPSLPSLETVELLVVEATAATSLRLGALEDAGDIWIADNPALEAVSLTALHTVDNQLEIVGNAALEITNVSADTAGAFIFGSNGAVQLATIEIGALTEGLRVEGNAGSGLITVDVEDRGAEVWVRDNGVASVVVRSTEPGDGPVHVVGNTTPIVRLDLVGHADLRVEDNPAVQVIEIPSTSGGALSVAHNPLLMSVSAPALQDLSGGSLAVTDNPMLTALHVPAVAVVRNLIVEDCPALPELYLFDLYSAERITIRGTGLVALDFPLLWTLTGAIELEDNAQLTQVYVDQLQGTAASTRVDIRNNPVLTGISMSGLRDVAAFELMNAPALTVLWLPMLDTVGGNFSVIHTGLVAMDGVAATVAADHFTVQNNTALLSLAPFSLRSAQTVHIVDNAELCGFEVAAFLEELAPGAMVFVRGGC